MTKRRPRLPAAAAGLLLCLGVAAHAQGKPPDAKAILREMVARYAGLTSYRDTGVVQTLPGGSPPAAGPARAGLPDAPAGGDTLVSFKTYYARPGRFRFEWKGSPASRERVVWSDGKRSYGWMPSGAFGEGSFVFDGGSELLSYIEEAQRSSSGAAFFVPSLLMKDAGYDSFGRMVLSMADLSVPREERLDGELCHVVSGEIFGTPWLLWVGKESRLLRKTRTVYTSGSFHDMLEKRGVKTTTAEEVHRDIRVDEKLPAAAFTYRPRLGPGDIDLTR